MVISSFLELGTMTERTERILKLAHETSALLSGEFTLASGKKSNHYFEGKRLTLHPEGAYLIGKEIFFGLINQKLTFVIEDQKSLIIII